MKKEFGILAMLFASLLWGCKNSPQTTGSNVLARVGDKELARTEVIKIIPKGVSTVDSLLYAETYIKRWVKDALVYEVALKNLGSEKNEVDKLVEEYRNSLMRHRYQERLVRERLTTEIRESEKLNYYEENQKKFVLDKSLIKGLFLKVPANAPGLSDIKNWYRQTSMEAMEKIEKYSLQNASIYDYFYDRWVNFDEIMDNIPMSISDQSQFLKSNKHIELADSSYCYLLNINEYIAAGTVAPYDYAAAQITEILINQQKVDFLKRFEEELYNDAIRKGTVVLTRDGE